MHRGGQHAFSGRVRCGGISIDPSALNKAIEGCEVKVRPIFLTWEVVISVRIERSAEAVTQRRQFHQ